MKVQVPLLAFFISLSVVACGSDAPEIVRPCQTSSRAKEVHIWRDSISLFPRSEAEELLPKALWQGIERTMSRNEIETLLAPHLRLHHRDWSEFETPLGRLRWVLHREYSGAGEASIERIHLYPTRLTLREVLGADVMECLERSNARSKYVVVMRSSGNGQLATLEVDGAVIHAVTWDQASDH